MRRRRTGSIGLRRRTAPRSSRCRPTRSSVACLTTTVRSTTRRNFSISPAPNAATRLCMTFAHSKVRTFEDALRQRAVIGATSVGSPTREYAAMVKHATGARFEIVSGYQGPPSLFLAMARGEIDGVCGLDWSALKSQQPQWLAEKKLNLLIQASIEPEPELAEARRSDPVEVHQARDRPQGGRGDGRVPAGLRKILHGGA